MASLYSTYPIPRAPIEIGFLQLLYGAWSVAVEGETAYVAAHQSGAYRRSTSPDPEVPVALGRLATPLGAAAALAMTNGLAYVLDHDGRFVGALRVIDLSIPTTPIEVGTTTVSGTTFRPEVAVVGDLAYVTVGEEGLRVIDVSNPATPVAISAIDTPGFAAGVTGGGQRCLHRGWRDRSPDLRFRQADGACRNLRNRHPGLRMGRSRCEWARLRGRRRFGAAGDRRFQPASARRNRCHRYSRRAVDVAVVGGLAYVADYYEGLRIIDVSNPEQPVEIGALDTPGAVARHSRVRRAGLSRRRP